MQVISEICGTYATVVEDMGFLALIKFMRGELMAIADADLINKADTSLKNVKPKTAEIEGYDLKASDLDELETLNNEFEAINTLPESNKASIAKLTARLDELMKQTDTLLKKMDAILLSGRTTEPDFWEEYTRKRALIELAKRKRALQLWVKEDETGLPLSNTIFTIADKSKAGAELSKAVKMTGEQGGVSQNNMGAGEYDYEVTFNGKLAETGSFFINDRLMPELTIRLKSN